MIEYTVVIPTTGRDSLHRLLESLSPMEEARPRRIIVVDDRPGDHDLHLPRLPVEVSRLHCGGLGPAAARNLGWRHCDTEWVAFLDDDVVVTPGWHAALVADLTGLPQDVAGSTAYLTVPLPYDRRPTDAERGTAGLATARWITADIAYRKPVLELVGGFDDRFPRAFREDADLGLRIVRCGYTIVAGRRRTVHPPKTGGWRSSVAAQAGNADNALMRRKHGRHWRRLAGERVGRIGEYSVITAAGLTATGAALTRHRRTAAVAAALWTALTARLAYQRIKPGPATLSETTRMLVSSALIPAAACGHRLRGELRHRRVRPCRPAAVLFDRDDTLIVDVPYLNDPAKVRPMASAMPALTMLRRAGIPIGVVSNQSGVARGLISRAQLAAVNAAVRRQLGPFQTWQVCPHDPRAGCVCRKPAPGLIQAAAADLGVAVRDCVVIGDIGADIAAAAAAGAHGILVPTAKTLPDEVAHAQRHARLAGDLVCAVRLALAGVR
jgi:histidinol-phosphate phosphatase family protein